jgi:hypothetical protein
MYVVLGIIRWWKCVFSDITLHITMSAVIPLAVLKRKRDHNKDVDYKLCLFCQEKSTEILRLASEDGKSRVQVVAADKVTR